VLRCGDLPLHQLTAAVTLQDAARQTGAIVSQPISASHCAASDINDLMQQIIGLPSLLHDRQKTWQISQIAETMRYSYNGFGYLLARKRSPLCEGGI
jgi:hypothetical protein